MRGVAISFLLVALGNIAWTLPVQNGKSMVIGATWPIGGTGTGFPIMSRDAEKEKILPLGNLGTVLGNLGTLIMSRDADKKKVLPIGCIGITGCTGGGPLIMSREAEEEKVLPLGNLGTILGGLGTLIMSRDANKKVLPIGGTGITGGLGGPIIMSRDAKDKKIWAGPIDLMDPTKPFQWPAGIFSRNAEDKKVWAGPIDLFGETTKPILGLGTFPINIFSRNAENEKIWAGPIDLDPTKPFQWPAGIFSRNAENEKIWAGPIDLITNPLNPFINQPWILASRNAAEPKIIASGLFGPGSVLPPGVLSKH